MDDVYRSSSKELRLTDLLLANTIEAIEEESPFFLEEAFVPPSSSFQGERKFIPEFEHFMSAPELLPAINPLKDPRRYYGQQVDMWIIGCIIFNMVAGVPPFFIA